MNRTSIKLDGIKTKKKKNSRQTVIAIFNIVAYSRILDSDTHMK